MTSCLTLDWTLRRLVDESGVSGAEDDHNGFRQRKPGKSIGSLTEERILNWEGGSRSKDFYIEKAHIDRRRGIAKKKLS